MHVSQGLESALNHLVGELIRIVELHDLAGELLFDSKVRGLESDGIAKFEFPMESTADYSLGGIHRGLGMDVYIARQVEARFLVGIDDGFD